MIPPTRIILTAALCLTMSAIASAQTPQQLQTEIVGLVAANIQLQAQNALLASELVVLHKQVNTMAMTTNALSTFANFVSVDFNPENGVRGPNIVFKGANIHIVSGSGSTVDHTTGLGNLIIGYDEPPLGLLPSDRVGSHTLIMGMYNTFTSNAFGGVILGTNNRVTSDFSSILGGINNLEGGDISVIVGGDYNDVFGGGAEVVVGGLHNACADAWDVVLGGSYNEADGADSVVVSGDTNTTQAGHTSILGGRNIQLSPSAVAGVPASGPITILSPISMQMN